MTFHTIHLIERWERDQRTYISGGPSSKLYQRITKVTLNHVTGLHLNTLKMFCPFIFTGGWGKFAHLHSSPTLLLDYKFWGWTKYLEDLDLFNFIQQFSENVQKNNNKIIDLSGRSTTVSSISCHPVLFWGYRIDVRSVHRNSSYFQQRIDFRQNAGTFNFIY